MSVRDKFGLEHAPLCPWVYGRLMHVLTRARTAPDPYAPRPRRTPNGDEIYECCDCGAVAAWRDGVPNTDSAEARPIWEAVEEHFAETGERPALGEVAARLGLSERTLQRRMEAGKLGGWHKFVRAVCEQR